MDRRIMGRGAAAGAGLTVALLVDAKVGVHDGETFRGVRLA